MKPMTRTGNGCCPTWHGWPAAPPRRRGSSGGRAGAGPAEGGQQREEYSLRHTSGYYVRLPFSVGLEALEGALAIGRQADPLGPGTGPTPAQAGRSKATTPTSIRTVPFFSKVKSWLTMKEMEPMA